MSDLIRRQDAIDAISKCTAWKMSKDDKLISKVAVVNELFLVPSAEPKTGKWIKNYSVIQCSECKRSSWSLSFEDLVKSFNYCPNCGAKMVKEGD